MRLSLKAQIPFFFTKYGDGALQCINGIGTRTRDGEVYSSHLARELLRTWAMLKDRHKRLYLADWFSARFDAKQTGLHEAEYLDFVKGCNPTWLNYEAVLIDRQTQPLISFYETLKRDPRRKVIMGPAEWLPAVKMLNADGIIVTPMGGVFEVRDFLLEQLVKTRPEIVLYGAGMAGTIPVIDHWGMLGMFTGATYISLGSALDPLFRCQSRIDQLPMHQAQRAFRHLL